MTKPFVVSIGCITNKFFDWNTPRWFTQSPLHQSITLVLTTDDVVFRCFICPPQNYMHTTCFPVKKHLHTTNHNQTHYPPSNCGARKSLPEIQLQSKFKITYNRAKHAHYHWFPVALLLCRFLFYTQLENWGVLNMYM